MLLLLTSKYESEHESDDEEEKDDGKPIMVNIAQYEAAVREHMEARDTVLLDIPDGPISLGMFVVDCSTIRKLLVEKHETIIDMLLKHLVVLTHKLAKHMVKEFDEVALKLSEVPQDIEGVTAMREFLGQVPALIEPLEEDIQKMK